MWSYIFLKITINDGRGTHFQHKMKNKHVHILIFVYVWQRRIPVGKFISINLLTIHFSSIPLSALPLLWFLPQAYFLIYIFNKISLPLKLSTLFSLFRSFHVWLRRKSGSKYFKKTMVMSYHKQEVAAQKVKSDTRRLASFLIYMHIYIHTYVYSIYTLYIDT